MAGRLCQVRQRSGLHGRLIIVWRLAFLLSGAKQLLLGRGFMSTLVNAAPDVAITTPRRSRLTAAKRRQYGAAYALVLPFFIIFVAMVIVPLVYAGYLSFFRKRLIGGTSFAGAENYVKALTDPLFLSGVGRMAIFLIIQVPFMIALALFFALALDSGMMKLAKFSRLAIFVPYAVPSVVATLMWGYLYGPDFGPFAQISRGLGMGPPPFFTQTGMLFSIMNIVNWSFIGYNMIIIYAALRSLPSELYEAARVDGASEPRIAWSIKIPAVRPALLLTVIFSVIGTFQLFAEPKLMATLAPNVIGTAWSPNLYAYNVAFVNQDANYAAALAFLLGIVIMIVSYIVQLSTQRRERLS
jgi:multiple sugar transport system permease protein